MSLSTRGEALLPQADDHLPSAHTYDRKTNPGGLIAPAYAINETVSPDLAAFAKNVTIKPEHFTFHWPANGGPGLRPALATHLNDSFHPHTSVNADHIVIGEGATSILEILAFALMSPGDGLLLSRPIYNGYSRDFTARAGARVCFANTDAEDSLHPEALVATFEKTLARYREKGVQIRAVLIANPNNPLGRCYPRDTLLAIARFCQKHNLHFLSDEIFGATAFGDNLSSLNKHTTTPFTSLFSLPLSSPDSPIDPKLCHVIYGLAKDFGAAGLRIGALISQSNPALLASARAMLRFHDVSGPSVAIATAMLEDRDWCRQYLDKTRTGLAKAYEHATAGLENIGVDYVRGGGAGFFVFIDLSPYLAHSSDSEVGPFREEEQGPSAAEVALVRKMIDNGLYLAPRGESYSKPGWFRFVFSHEPHVIDEALRRLSKTISP
ncbi:putative aspartate aminotransferase [Microdochium bolleyi]|uniref:Putative aspartate aminotransferase n=1 Tax=Microdochium bolleyi TaxID=196109 RepID=A0A136IVN9_9PEZI|nr:putative aspartate aminotransferase [Microdochium bolleyi]